MKQKRYVVAIDQGTTSCRAIVFDPQGAIVSTAQKEFTQFFPKSGWVEHDAEEIWQVQLEVLREAVKSIDLEEIAAIGITNQRETTVVWDKLTGKPLHRAIVWQCRRTSTMCEELKHQGWEPIIRNKTGLVLDAYFSGTKLKWLLDNNPDIRAKAERGEALFGTIDSWLIWKLTEGRQHVTDASNASRTMLLNIHSVQWDDDILQQLNIPKAMLPEVKSSSEVYGHTELLGAAAAVRIPIAGAAGDQQAALFGQACFTEGMAKNTYGTGCFVLKQTGEKPVMSEKGLITTIAWSLNGKVYYALEGSVFNAGTVVQWLRDGLGIIESAAETEAIARSVEHTEGVYFVPAFTGLGTPYWEPDARGMITGLTRASTRAHIVRAALESIAFQSSEVLQVMEEESGIHLRELRVDGGAVKNEFLMQFQADLLGVAVTRPRVIETTALGAAFLAGLAVGLWSDLSELEQLKGYDRSFSPAKDEAYRKQAVSGWQRAVAYQLGR
ncbi:glycerol kinase GlpK [Paenibacillus radicis (ex Xue et al. 2023)]|uniref:Glycerol kinase n=1 Tax=Paenibacillus radicis (ex Xue et al. 2023) TaxID=2972489 RepID=A0ABT1Y9C2_9BACL|nr:glycerol kinase GlpK [Paenibacillus radicis (ex Xue et al. 2023)]MCR8629778.1 glycerol kinase GlpK [Paenibacillus radicis (ex Xue et al. 2023)]